MLWFMFNASEICLFFFRLPFFSQSPSTKQHVSGGLQVKIRKHLTRWDTERKFNCLMYCNFFNSWPVQDFPFFTHWFYRLCMKSFFYCYFPGDEAYIFKNEKWFGVLLFLESLFLRYLWKSLIFQTGYAICLLIFRKL